VNEIIIISISSRALAESASRAGYNVNAIDCFADSDTQSVANIVYQVAYREDGFIESELISRTQEILASLPDARIILGSGFESNTELIDKLKLLAPTISNTKETVTKLKDPFILSRLLEKNKIAHPATQSDKPNTPKGFLIKKSGGQGGTHVNYLEKSNSNITDDHYYQELIVGDVLSVLFLANGKQAKVVGFNQQLKSKDFADLPFLYKGAIKLNKNNINNREVIENIINIITSESDLKGLCGLDYITKENGEIVVLEVNPRPPATFELHETQQSLFEFHIAAFNGELQDVGAEHEKDIRYDAHAILYAKEKLTINDNFDWPKWIKDRPHAGSNIQIKSPVCTVHASENSIDKTKSLLFNRLSQIETMLKKSSK
jgi:predicted ATP-grasp superfamily ATP-dependent carboligase